MFTDKEKETLQHIMTWSDEEIANWVGDDIVGLLKEKIGKVTKRLHHKKITTYSNQSYLYQSMLQEGDANACQ